MTDRSIIKATTDNCIAYQNDAADAYAIAMWEIHNGALSRAVMLQERARHLHNLAWERLARLIGAE